MSDTPVLELSTEDSLDFSISEDESLELTLGDPETLEADLGNPQIIVNNDHRALSHRSDDDQHPISAITDLEETLDGFEDDISDLETELGTKQDTLVSGVNIKTVDNQSVVGGGNLDTAPGWDNVQSKPNFATVATTGDYDDLTDKFYFAVNQSEGLVITKF